MLHLSTVLSVVLVGFLGGAQWLAPTRCGTRENSKVFVKLKIYFPIFSSVSFLQPLMLFSLEVSILLCVYC